MERRLLCLVARDRPQLFEYVRQAFAEEDDVVVIFDRREAGRSSSYGGTPERRRQALEDLRGLGRAFVRVAGPG
jgi:hypothetical protein